MVYTPAGTVFTGTAGFQLKGTTGTFDYIHIEEHVM
jgi:hypothetical protein